MKNMKHTSRIQLFLTLALLVTFVLGGADYQTAFGRNLAQLYQCNGKAMTEIELSAYRQLSVETAQKLDAYGVVRFSELCSVPQTVLDEALTALKNIGDMNEFRRLQLQDQNGQLSVGAYIQAQQEYNALTAPEKPQIASAGIDSDSWNWVGPGNIGGRVRALVVHPDDTDIMWAGAISGGIWKTIDGGVTWQVQDDFMVSMAVTSLVINPANPDILYAGTGDGFGNDKIVSRWIFKTTDGGVTWTQLERGTDNTNAEYVHDLAISPDGSTLLAATEDGIVRCLEAATGNNCYDNTDWDLIYTKDTYQVTDIEFRTDAIETVVAGGENGLIIRSTDVKVGTPPNWTKVTLEPGEGVGMGRADVAYASDSSTVYVSAAVIDYDPSLDGDHIYKSTDDGQNFTRQSPVGRDYFLDDSGNLANVIWIDPEDPTKIVVGGGDLYRSFDSGVNITQISDGVEAPASAFSGQHIAISGAEGQVIFATNGGVYRADSIDDVVTTSGWTSLNNNLGVTAFYSAALTANGDIVGGTLGTGMLRHQDGTGTETWTVIEDGDNGFVAADPADNDLVYGSLPYLQIFRNDGETSTDISGTIGGFDHANYIAPFVLDPHNTDQILAGGDKLWKADNVDELGAPSWDMLRDSIGSNISAIAVGANSNTIWLGYNNGQIWKTDNGGASWVQKNSAGLTNPNRQVTRLVVDGSVVYATFAGFQTDNVWKTTNDGASWTQVGTLPLAAGLPVYDLIIRPSFADHLYIGTEFGVFVTQDGGTNWSASSDVDGPTSSSVQDILLNGTTLIAATYGRGVYAAEIGSSQHLYDDFDAAHDISAKLNEEPPDLPYIVEDGTGAGTSDTTNATRSGDDPAIADCDLTPGLATVWYTFNLGTSLDLEFDTNGSSYDTYIAVWTGDRGNLVPVACNDDASDSDTSSHLAASFTENTDYYVVIGQKNDEIASGSVGGDLKITIDDDVYSISGTVSSGDGPIEGATVKANTGVSTLTAGDGTYTLFPVPDGEVTVTASAIGYGEKSRVMIVSGNRTGEDFDIGLSFEDPATRWTQALDYSHGWRVSNHPRMFADVDGDGDDDAVGFGLDGIYVALSDGSSFAASATRWTTAFDYNHGWRVSKHPRMFADVDGDGDDDAVGFGLDGIYVALSDGSSFAANATRWTTAFDYNHGWRVSDHPRMFADVNGDGMDDAVGFGLDGIYVALSNGSSFAANATRWTAAFDYNHGWRVSDHPRMFADVDGDGDDDAVGFGLDGIYVTLSDGSSFAPNAVRWTNNAFDYNHGWRVSKHPRMFADVNGDGMDDAVGFGLDGAYVALSSGNSLATNAVRWTTALDYSHGWRVTDHPRMFADVNGDGRYDAAGFGLDGIYIALSE